MICFSEVYDTAAGLRDGRAEFCIAETAEQGYDAADEPAEKRHALAHARTHEYIGAEVKDSGTYHDSADDADSAEQRDLTSESGIFGSKFSNFALIVVHLKILRFYFDGFITKNDQS